MTGENTYAQDTLGKLSNKREVRGKQLIIESMGTGVANIISCTENTDLGAQSKIIDNVPKDGYVLSRIDFMNSGLIVRNPSVSEEEILIPCYDGGSGRFVDSSILSRCSIIGGVIQEKLVFSTIGSEVTLVPAVETNEDDRVLLVGASEVTHPTKIKPTELKEGSLCVISNGELAIYLGHMNYYTVQDTSSYVSAIPDSGKKSFFYVLGLNTVSFFNDSPLVKIKYVIHHGSPVIDPFEAFSIAFLKSGSIVPYIGSLEAIFDDIITEVDKTYSVCDKLATTLDSSIRATKTSKLATAAEPIKVLCLISQGIKKYVI